MPRTTDSRDRMVRGAGRLLRRQGYAATGWRQVVSETATPWGSQAHHFPGGKEQLAAEAIVKAGAAYERLLRAALADAHPADAVAAWAELAGTELAASEWADGCPVATVALEMAHTSDALAAACHQALTSWQTSLAEAMTARGAAAAEAGALAALVVAAMEGALLLARTGRDIAPLRLVGDQLAELLRARVPFAD